MPYYLSDSSLAIDPFERVHLFSTGSEFLTIVTQGREPLLGEVAGMEMRLSPSGLIVQRAWFDLPLHYTGIQLDAFCIMPNHVTGIIVLVVDDGCGRGGSGSLIQVCLVQ